MKKTFFTLTIIAFCAGGALAQGISGGIKLGANFANQKMDFEGFDFSPKSRTSLHGGFFLTIMMSETFGIQPELLYNSVGSKIEFMGENGISRLNYLSVPLMLRYNPVPVFNIQVGPQFGFLLSAEDEYDGQSEDVKEDYKQLDLGVGIGAGVDLPMGIGLSARYVMGLSNIADIEDAEDLKVTNTTVQLSLTYKLFGK